MNRRNFLSTTLALPLLGSATKLLAAPETPPQVSLAPKMNLVQALGWEPDKNQGTLHVIQMQGDPQPLIDTLMTEFHGKYNYTVGHWDFASGFTGTLLKEIRDPKPISFTLDPWVMITPFNPTDEISLRMVMHRVSDTFQTQFTQHILIPVYPTSRYFFSVPREKTNYSMNSTDFEGRKFHNVMRIGLDFPPEVLTLEERNNVLEVGRPFKGLFS